MLRLDLLARGVIARFLPFSSVPFEINVNSFASRNRLVEAKDKTSSRFLGLLISLGLFSFCLENV